MVSFVLLLLIQLSCCALMTGVIWIIQLVHYPSFRYVDSHEFLAFSRFHQQMISFVVIPPMLLELASAVYLAFVPHPQHKLLVVNLGLLGLIWLSTFLLSVPLHNTLSQEMDFRVIHKLVVSNWPRTVLWSMRLGLLFYLVAKN